MVKRFIDRPILAWVVAIMIMLAGILSILRLPVAQYPDVAPPSVTVSANYSGASAQVVQDTVVQIIEQSLSGIDNVQYISATCDSTGKASITVTFNTGTNPDIAQVQVQNKLQTAMPLKQSRYSLPLLQRTRVPCADSTSTGSNPATMLVIMYSS